MSTAMRFASVIGSNLEYLFLDQSSFPTWILQNIEALSALEVLPSKMIDVDVDIDMRVYQAAKQQFGWANTSPALSFKLFYLEISLQLVHNPIGSKAHCCVHAEIVRIPNWKWDSSATNLEQPTDQECLY
ncbi:hypothetical protein NC652_028902 [Populus alba x Populus x berolinensis]|nr:hypothetical protein NC652_028902 [Populus alba x Populus x berolinensis]